MSRIRKTVACAAVCAAITVPAPEAAAQIAVSGQIDLVGTARRDSLGLNSALRGDNPFNPMRLRIFVSSWVSDRVGVFTEFLYDIEADPRVNGAYVVVNELAGKPWLGARLGLAPNLMGSFGLRSTYFNANPLISVPLVWGYRTNLSSSGTSTASSLAAATTEPGTGMPMLYDTCWNIQWELLGEAGNFAYSVGVTPGALSNPIRARAVGGSQWLGRLGWSPLSGLRMGASAARGPYLSSPSRGSDGSLPYPEDPSSFDQTVVGFDLEYGSGRWIFQSEAFRSSWEVPLVDEPLDAAGAYVEARFDFTTGWYLAGRVEALWFGEIAPGTGLGDWDQDMQRTEVALGYRLGRETLVKLDWQRTTTVGDFERNLFAVQLSTVF